MSISRDETEQTVLNRTENLNKNAVPKYSKSPNNSKFTQSDHKEFCINITEKKNNSDWNVSLETNDCVITYKIYTGAQADVILKQTLPKSAVIEPTNVKLSADNGSSIPAV